MSATLQIEDGIAILTMDDGKANVINPTMLAALHDCLDQAEKEAKALVITGRENRFSAGFDLKMLTGGSLDSAKDLVLDGGKFAHRLYGFPMPVFGACNGHAIAMGCFILLACDVRFGTEGDYKIGANETMNDMVIPEYAVELMHARLTPGALVQSAIFGQMFDPKGAIKAGYLDDIGPAGSALEKAVATAKMTTVLPGGAVTGNKRLLRQSTLHAMIDSIEAALAS